MCRETVNVAVNCKVEDGLEFGIFERSKGRIRRCEVVYTAHSVEFVSDEMSIYDRG